MLVIMYSIIKTCIDTVVTTLLFILTFWVTFTALWQIPDRFWLTLLDKLGWIAPPKILVNNCRAGYQSNHWYDNGDEPLATESSGCYRFNREFQHLSHPNTHSILRGTSDVCFPIGSSSHCKETNKLYCIMQTFDAIILIYLLYYVYVFVLSLLIYCVWKPEPRWQCTPKDSLAKAD